MDEFLELVVTMPVFNESEGIVDFLTEICAEFNGTKFALVLVDDASTDDTFAKTQEYFAGKPLAHKVHRNSKNEGHGKSTIIGIDLALTFEASIVLTIDGDGQFIASEVRELFHLFQKGDYAVIEGVRRKRDEPFFRRATTAVTRMLVFVRSHNLPKDANTPLRIYKRPTLLNIRANLSDDLLTPNLHISAFVRSKNFSEKIGEESVTSTPRRGSNPVGTMWKSKVRKLPSKRFIRFSIEAISQWLRTSKLINQ